MIGLGTLDRLRQLKIDLPKGPSLEQIAAEWDRNATERAAELQSGVDSVFQRIILPTIEGLVIGFATGNRIIDVGSGLGHISHHLAGLGYDVEGIDISRRSVELASRFFPSIPFINISIEDYVLEYESEFDTCVANMVFHNVPNLTLCLASIHRMLAEEGKLVFSIPHPCFWYRRRSFSNSQRFRYCETACYKTRFKIRNGYAHPSPITYVHRPLEVYLTALIRSGFRLRDIVEPCEKPLGYPELLFVVCSKDRF